MVALLFELMTLLTLWLCLSTWQRDRSARGRRLFMALCLAASCWSAAYLADEPGGLSRQAAERLLYLGVLAVPPLWFSLALRIRAAPVVERRRVALTLLFAPGVACYAVLLAGDPHGWFLRRPSGAPGPLWWASAGYGWAIATAGSLQFARAALQTADRDVRRRRLGAAIASFAPIVGSLIFVGWGLSGIDPTPFFLAAALVALRSELYSGDLLQALPLSHHDLVSHIPTPLILTDLDDRVTEINPAAQLRLGVRRHDALERSLGAVLADALDPPRLDRWSIVAAGREVGHVLLVSRPKRSAGVAR